MDRKTIIVIVCCLLLLVGWNALVNHFFPPLKPQPGLATNEVATLTSPAATNVADTSSVPVLSATPVQADAARVAIDTNVPEQLITLTNENARYTFTSHGGGLKLVELIKYPEEVGRKRGQPASERLATLNRDAFLPTLAVLDGEMVQGNGIFQLSATGNVVRAEKLLPNGLSIVKEFTLSTNYLVLARVQLQNTS
ncbi:MAG TPA: hypothetical protein PKH32_14185, partial [Verrucomicrobiota bacterium]|nr:hypothetical protein [Verrucomicrobiota bacterium]